MSAKRMTKNPKKTKMFQGLGDTAFEFSHKNFTYNSHRYGISSDFLESDIQLKEFWDVTSISLMPNGTEFTASIEAKNYPIFGTQYHPEKPSQLWVDGYNINHSWESIKLQQHFSEIFVAMSRYNPNTFGNFT